MGEGYLFRHYRFTANRAVERVCRNGGAYLIVICEEVVAVIASLHRFFLDYLNVAAVRLAEHIVAVIYISERGVHKDSRLDIVDLIFTSVDCPVGYVHHTVLVRVRAHKSYRLFKFYAVYRPRRNDRVGKLGYAYLEVSIPI